MTQEQINTNAVEKIAALLQAVAEVRKTGKGVVYKIENFSSMFLREAVEFRGQKVLENTAKEVASEHIDDEGVYRINTPQIHPTASASQ